MTFDFDMEATLDAFARAGMLHMMGGQLTLFGVACVGSDGSPHSSHGGVLFLTATQALKFAQQCNDLANEDTEVEDPCHYLPTAMSVEPDQLRALLAAMDSDGWKEDE